VKTSAALGNQNKNKSSPVWAKEPRTTDFLDGLSRLCSKRAILEALAVLGLKAERYKDSESEFDVLFTWNGQRFLGEAEGKDNKAVNVDKISQLERNLSEDYEREEVKDYAKGMLFGNAFRLQKLSERGDFFTEKCVSSAKRLKAVLIRTPDLFFAARYVKESGDANFAKRCVEVIIVSEGTVVSFPTAPSPEPKLESEAQTVVLDQTPTLPGVATNENASAAPTGLG